MIKPLYHRPFLEVQPSISLKLLVLGTCLEAPIHLDHIIFGIGHLRPFLFTFRVDIDTIWKQPKPW